MHLQKVKFFLVFEARNKFPSKAGPPLAGHSSLSTNIFQNKNITVNGVEQQEPKNFEKVENGLIGFQK